MTNTRVLLFTVEKEALQRGIVLGDQRIDVPQQLVLGGGWAGLILTAQNPATLLDQGLVGRHVWTSAPAEFVAESLCVGDCEARLPHSSEGFPRAGVVRAYELPVTQGRPPFVFLEVLLVTAETGAIEASEQPARHRAIGFVAQGGHGFSLAAPAGFDRYLASLEDGNAMRRFTTTDAGDHLLAAGHFLPVWGVHQWDYRLVICRGSLPPSEHPLLGRLVLPKRGYPIDLGDDGRLDVLTNVPELQDTRKGLTRFEVMLWPGKYRAAISGFTTGDYGVGLIPTYLLELEAHDGSPPDEPLNGESLPFLFESFPPKA